MNILQQEDLVKGLPDQALMQQAQMPTGELPQFLVVSEIQRREKMRKSFAEAVPEESIKDQVISSGIAAMNPTPDPLMANAMGVQGGQDPMMGQTQDPMMQQQVMAADGGMMPYRMEEGRDVPFPLEDNIKNKAVPDVIPENFKSLLDDAVASGDVAEEERLLKLFISSIDNMSDKNKKFIVPDRNHDSPLEGLLAGRFFQGNFVIPYIRRIKELDPSYIDPSPERRGSEEDRYNNTIDMQIKEIKEKQGILDLANNLGRTGGENNRLASTEDIIKAYSGDIKSTVMPEYVPQIPSGKEFEDDIPALKILESKITSDSAPTSKFTTVESLISELERKQKDNRDSNLRPSLDSGALEEDTKLKLGDAGYIKQLDPDLYKMITAPEAGGVKVNERVREKIEQEENALNVVDEMSEARYQIQKGDTLSGISRDKGTTIADIMALNPQIEDADMIFAGDTLNLSGGGITPYKMYDGRRIPDIKRFMAELGISEDLLMQATPEEIIKYEEAMNKAIERERAAGIANLREQSYPVSASGMFPGSFVGDVGGPYSESYDSKARRKDIAAEKAALGGRDYLEGSDIVRTFNKNVLAAEQAKDRKLFDPGTLSEYAQYKNIEISEPEFKNIFAQFAQEDSDIAAQTKADADAAVAKEDRAGLDMSDFPAATSIDLSGVVNAQKASPLDYLQFRVPYEGLLDKEEARSKRASEEARRDAASNALIQLGAGIAAGDLSKGLSEAGKVAMLGKKDARAEDRNLSALKRQIDLAGRTQESTLGIRGMEAKSKQDIALSELGVRAAEYAYKENTDLRASYIELQKLKQKYREAENKQPYYDALALQAKSLAQSREFDSLYSPAFIDANIRQLLMDDKTGELSLQLSGMSDPQRRDWWKRTQATQVLGGTVGNMSSDVSGYTIESR